MNKKILYSDKVLFRGELSRCSREDEIRAIRDIDIRRNAILNCLEREFDVDFAGPLEFGVVNLISEKLKDLEPYVGMVSHFPYDKDFLDSDKVMSMKGDEVRKRMYKPSFDIIKKIKTINSDLIMLAYTGSSSGESDDPSSLAMNQMLTEAGFRDIVYKTRDCNRDGMLILEKIKKLIG